MLPKEFYDWFISKLIHLQLSRITLDKSDDEDRLSHWSPITFFKMKSPQGKKLTLLMKIYRSLKIGFLFQ